MNFFSYLFGVAYSSSKAKESSPQSKLKTHHFLPSSASATARAFPRVKQGEELRTDERDQDRTSGGPTIRWLRLTEVGPRVIAVSVYSESGCTGLGRSWKITGCPHALTPLPLPHWKFFFVRWAQSRIRLSRGGASGLADSGVGGTYEIARGGTWWI